MAKGIMEIANGNATIAYLHGFGIDDAQLQHEHKNWLATHVISRISIDAITMRVTKSRQFFMIWLLGTTSRTASRAYNKTLSENRARAIETHLNQNLKGHAPYVKIATTGLSKYAAAVKGKADETEDPLDRAVLIYVQKLATPQPPPNVQRPRTNKTFYIRLSKIQVDTLDVPTGKAVGGRYDVLKAEFDIAETFPTRHWSTYRFSSHLPSTTFGPSDPYEGDRPIAHRDFVAFTVPGNMTSKDFAGRAMWVVPDMFNHTYKLLFGGGRTPQDEAKAKMDLPIVKPTIKFRFTVEFEDDTLTYRGVKDTGFPGTLKLVP